MDHFPFIFWSYAGAALLVAGLVGWIAWDARRVARRLAQLESQGVRRRSAAGSAHT